MVNESFNDGSNPHLSKESRTMLNWYSVMFIVADSSTSLVAWKYIVLLQTCQSEVLRRQNIWTLLATELFAISSKWWHV